MNIIYLYAIPVVWVVLGILYLRTLPKDGFSGVGEAFLVMVIGLLLLIAVVVYHSMVIIKKRRSTSKTS